MLHVVKILVENKNYNLGYGIGLRRSHFNEILSPNSNLPDWFEIISENYMTYGGKPKEILQYLKEKKIPIINHGVGLSLGSVDEFNKDYLVLLKDLLSATSSPWFTDHLCFSSTNKHQYHDLIPILRNEKTLEHIIDKIKFIEDYFQIPFAFENISYYGESNHNTLSEIDFINQILEKTNSYLLLDINNIYVNAENHHFDAHKYIDDLNIEKVIQLHLAGHWDRGDIIIDTHGDFVNDSVWDLYRYFIKKIGKEVSTLIEWDNEIPDYKTVLEEAAKAKKIANEVLNG